MIGHGGPISGTEREGLSPPLSILLSLPLMAVAIFASDLRRATLLAVQVSSHSSLSLSFHLLHWVFLSSRTLSFSLSPQGTTIGRSSFSGDSTTTRAVQHYSEEAETRCLSLSATKTPMFGQLTVHRRPWRERWQNAVSGHLWQWFLAPWGPFQSHESNGTLSSRRKWLDLKTRFSRQTIKTLTVEPSQTRLYF